MAQWSRALDIKLQRINGVSLNPIKGEQKIFLAQKCWDGKTSLHFYTHCSLFLLSGVRDCVLCNDKSSVIPYRICSFLYKSLTVDMKYIMLGYWANRIDSFHTNVVFTNTGVCVCNSVTPCQIWLCSISLKLYDT